MNEPLVPVRGPRTEAVLAGVLLAAVLLVAVGFLFPMPFGFGGWEVAVVATPVVLAAVVLAGVLRMARRR